MQLPHPKSSTLKHFTSISYEGKILIFAVDTAKKVFYAVRRDGFEERPGARGNTQPEWDDWRELDLPGSRPDSDASVAAHERVSNTVTLPPNPAPGWITEAIRLDPVERRAYFSRSVYDSRALTADAPVQLVSGFGHLYLFRASTRGTILVDRFVLDGLNNILIRKLDVRFKRSRQRHVPFSNGPNSIDALDFRDANGNPFLEPTTELTSVNRLGDNGNFAVVLTPTAEQERFQWHFFAVAGGKLELVSVRADKDGLFDWTDLPEQPAIHRRELTVTTGGTPIAIRGSIAATRYDRQVPSAGGKLIRDSVHAMLAVPTSTGVTTLSFAVTLTGALAQISTQAAARTTLQRQSRDVLLPPGELDRIERRLATARPLKGAITAISTTGKESRIRVDRAAADLPDSGLVRIEGSAGFNGRYQSQPADVGALQQPLSLGGTSLTLEQPLNADIPAGSKLEFIQLQRFTAATKALASRGQTQISIEPAQAAAAAGARVQLSGSLRLSTAGAPSLGDWEILTPSRLIPVQPGALPAITRAADGSLVAASGGTASPSVRIAGATGLDGVFSFRKQADGALQIGEPAGIGQLTAALEPRRPGLVFETDSDFIDLPGIETLRLDQPFTIEAFIRTASDGVIFSRDGQQSTNAAGQPEVRFAKALAVRNGRLTLLQDRAVAAQATGNIADDRSHHVAVSYRPGNCVLMVDGRQEASVNVTLLADVPNSGLHLAKAAEGVGGFRGTLAEVRVWEIARSAIDIVSSLEIDLTGHETGLAGNWRLGAIIEADGRRVADFAAVPHDGVVRGDPFAGEAQLLRNLAGQAEAAAFEGTEFFAAIPGATYEETFECRFSGGPVDPLTTPPFALTYSGRAGIDAVENRTFAGQSTTFRQPRPNEPIFEANYRFTVPEGLTLVRSFGIGQFAANWTSLRVRRHRVRLLVSSATEETFAEPLALSGVDSPGVSGAGEALRTFTEAQLAQTRLQRELDLVRSLGNKIRDLSSRIADPRNYWCQIRRAIESDGDFTSSDFLAFGPEGQPRLEPDAREAARFACLPGNRNKGASILPNATADRSRHFAMVVVRKASLEEMKTLAGFQPEETERLPLALSATQAVSLQPLRDREGFLARASARSRELAAEAEQQVPKPGLYDGISGSEVWRFHDQVPASIVTNAGTIANLDAPIRWRGPLLFGGSDPGNENRGLDLSAGTVSTDKGREDEIAQLFLEIPKADFSTPADPEAEERPIPGRPINKSMRQRLQLMFSQLQDALEEASALGMFPASGQGELDQLIRSRLAAATTATTAAATEYMNAIGNSAASLPMTTLSAAGAPRVLGVHLSVARPVASSRLSLTETSDGRVALHFPGSEDLAIAGRTDTKETQFRLREMSLDTAGQNWDVDSLRRGIRLTAPIGVEGLRLGADWTFEFWMLNPISIPSSAATAFLTLAGGSIVLAQHEFGQRFGFRRSAAGSDLRLATAFDFQLVPAGWRHIAVVARGSAKVPTTTFYVDGKAVGQLQGVVTGKVESIGSGGVGPLAEIRLWRAALGNEELETSRLLNTTGREPGLLLYVRPDSDPTVNRALGRPETLTLTFPGDASQSLVPFPLPSGVMPEFSASQVPAILTLEYPTYAVEPSSGTRTSIMRRCLAYPGPRALQVFGDKRVEALELVWTGNAQFAPTLLGYIEGAPPVPSENLTENPDGYEDATSVTLAQSDEVEISWTRAKENAFGGTFGGFIGVDEEWAAGVVLTKKAFSLRAGVTAAVDFSLQSQAETSVAFSSSLVSTDTLALRGAYERNVRFPTSANPATFPRTLATR